ncbi:MAG: tRNA adenosine(34) deaminase TadA [Cardiobacteriaceae bacterium]|nr:tRNA adenosine(34) deaminase TadA [Cardiobacteriaceae bacterium]
MNDRDWMALALQAAREAEAQGEVPIGAVLVKDGELLCRGRNTTIAAQDPCGHAEINCLRDAGQILGNHRLNGCALYVTLEPCVMCAGALLHARLDKLVFGAYDLRAGACGSVYDFIRETRLNHTLREVKGGVEEATCRTLLQDFFKRRR